MRCRGDARPSGRSRFGGRMSALPDTELRRAGRACPHIQSMRAYRPLQTALLIAFVALPAVAFAASPYPEWSYAGPDGGLVNSVLVDPQDPRVVYALGYQVGVFKSTDRGETWSLSLAGDV